jgi:hypothetical protein
MPAKAKMNGGGRPPKFRVDMAPGKSLIVVGPSQVLRKIPWLNMIEITPTRYLLTIPPGMSIEALEVTLIDLILSPEFQKKGREYTICLNC